MSQYRKIALFTLALCGSCTTNKPETLDSPILDIPETGSFSFEGLSSTVFVVRTEGAVPHIYASNRTDLSIVHGFTIAKDRFFMMDMSRRLALGTVSEILGADALSNDMEARGQGMRHIAEEIHRDLQKDPELYGLTEAYAKGINAYIEQVRIGLVPPPSEYELAAPLLGAANPVDLMEPFSGADVAACLATIVFELGFETGDARRGLSVQTLDGYYDDTVPNSALRNIGLRADLWDRIEPVYPTQSAPNWVAPASHHQTQRRERAPNTTPPPIPEALRLRVQERLDRIDTRLQRRHDVGFGSNVWAVAGSATADGRSLLASDGHLPLTVPPLFYQIGLDTQHLGEGPIHQLGMVIPGMFMMGPGTNGYTAWSQTQLFGDITDWYVEELTLDAAGKPISSLFQGEMRPLKAVDETFTVRDVPLLGSEGRTETWTRWTTFDGRIITDIEGRSAKRDEPLEDGETLIQMQGTFVVPQDLNGDGRIAAVSFDYVPLDGSGMYKAVDEFGLAKTVQEWREATKKLVGYSQNMIATDADGSIMYSSYQAVPCRGYLPKDDAGAWIEHAHPGLLIDGSQYGGFTIPRDQYTVDETKGQTDPYQCVVPWNAVPWSIDPQQQFLVNANNDPGGQSVDGTFNNDTHYIGGPWLEGYRADTIERILEDEVQANSSTLASMQALQGNHQSRLGEQFVPFLQEAIDRAADARDDPSDDPHTQRLAALFDTHEDDFILVAQKLDTWCLGGCQAKSGVDTFYDTPSAADKEDAVATMIFNAWYGRFLSGVFGDESLPSGIWFPTGDSGRQRTITRLMEGRGMGNPENIASWDPATGESAFFDDQRTEIIESSDEVALTALVDALAFLRSPPTANGQGGFGSEVMDEWLWGLRHWVRFESVLAELVGSDPTFAVFTDPFAISPERLPLAQGLTSTDPRYGLPGFPRNGDQLNVDAANPGTSGVRFNYGSGPVFRMVVALGPDGAEGVNILPGGQSGLKDSAHFDDQAALWLANDTWPMRFTVDEVVAGAISRETFTGTGNENETTDP